MKKPIRLSDVNQNIFYPGSSSSNKLINQGRRASFLDVIQKRGGNRSAAAKNSPIISLLETAKTRASALRQKSIKNEVKMNEIELLQTNDRASLRKSQTFASRPSIKNQEIKDPKDLNIINEESQISDQENEFNIPTSNNPSKDKELMKDELVANRIINKNRPEIRISMKGRHEA